MHPTGTVAFLFSDIEGSTERWERDRAAMEPALARHDALVREALESHRGYIFKTMGDAFCAAFSSAPDAIAAAYDAQRALSSEDFSTVGGLRTRMAVHAGQVDVRDGDYFGPVVNRVARLLAIGHGGQVIISGAAASLARDTIPRECSLRDLGDHQLKDLASPERVYQLIATGLAETFPALRSLDQLANNLPAQTNSFVGRDDAVGEIAKLLEANRLVTLVGPGGAGKTRCAIQVGAEVLDGSGGGVWLVEFAPIADPSRVAEVVAQTLGVQESPKRPILDTLLAYLQRKHLLLIFDNCEHLIDEVRRVAAAILASCPQVHVLATSREGLNVAGEQLYPMPPLAGTAALQLFADRALAVENRFALTGDNLPYVSEICERLDGMPLAIELAAARVNVLAPQRLAAMLDERFRVLTRGQRGALPRHQTMRALIDWSYDLLSTDERALFRKLSIFAGGFTLEAASVIAGGDSIDEWATLELLSPLVDKSLVQAEVTTNSTRYRLLESTRQYARERLTEAGEYDAVARAHAAACLALAEALDATCEQTADAEWMERADPELENFRAALSWTLKQRGDVPAGLRLAGMLWHIWRYFGAAEGQRWVQGAQENIDAATPPEVVARLDLAESELAALHTQVKACLAAGERALARYRTLDNPLHMAYAQRTVGYGLVQSGQAAQAQAVLTEALAIARANAAHKLTSATLACLALAHDGLGDSEGARRLYAEAWEVAKAVGAERRAAAVAIGFAEGEFRGGDREAALRLADEALLACREFNGSRGYANVLTNKTAYLVALGRFDDARAIGREALAAAHEMQLRIILTFAVQHLAAVAALEPAAPGEAREGAAAAARLLGYVDARMAALEAQREYTEQQEYEAMLPALTAALGAGELARLMAEGSKWSEDQGVEEAQRIYREERSE